MATLPSCLPRVTSRFQLNTFGIDTSLAELQLTRRPSSSLGPSTFGLNSARRCSLASTARAHSSDPRQAPPPADCSLQFESSRVGRVLAMLSSRCAFRRNCQARAVSRPAGNHRRSLSPRSFGARRGCSIHLTSPVVLQAACSSLRPLVHTPTITPSPGVSVTGFHPCDTSLSP
ncbi:hypothetical protein OH76DRAFT_465594 [Lentinus brumalis]|uniref:Uncharacterized protein n=1 Tax=Lentinus brumalis TaxID=2498619 RepID=A0A371DCI7_9APHY|nr:hypothetical protein OH76DRAFT_465594 [Polyporus brumalis]